MYQFFLYYFFHPKLCFIFLLQFFFIIGYNNFFAIKIFYCICPWNSTCNYFNYKNFRLIWNVTFCIKVVIFWYSYVITTWKFRIFIIILCIKVSIYALLYVGFTLIVVWYVLLYSLIISAKFINAHIFLILKLYIYLFYSSRFL